MVLLTSSDITNSKYKELTTS
uniref:Uncharacterized protein n=1 Tax=Anguilla anguilla TaxID=7936 RepID=A0A0E9U5R2_ANGAN